MPATRSGAGRAGHARGSSRSARDAPPKLAVRQRAALQPVRGGVGGAGATAQVERDVAEREERRGECGDGQEAPSASDIDQTGEVDGRGQPARAAGDHGDDDQQRRQAQGHLRGPIGRSRPGAEPCCSGGYGGRGREHRAGEEVPPQNTREPAGVPRTSRGWACTARCRARGINDVARRLRRAAGSAIPPYRAMRSQRPPPPACCSGRGALCARAGPRSRARRRRALGSRRSHGRHGARSPPDVTLPVVKKNDGAAYPRQALDEGFRAPAEVALTLTIDATGAGHQGRRREAGGARLRRGGRGGGAEARVSAGHCATASRSRPAFASSTGSRRRRASSRGASSRSPRSDRSRERTVVVRDASGAGANGDHRSRRRVAHRGCRAGHLPRHRDAPPAWPPTRPTRPCRRARRRARPTASASPRRAAGDARRPLAAETWRRSRSTATSRRAR